MVRRQTLRSIRYLAVSGIVFPLLAFGQSSPPPRTVWDGVYSQAQQERGHNAYGSYCSRCHGEDQNGARGVLRNPKFMDRWREDNLSSLFNLIKGTMPPGPRGRVSNAEYVDIVAYLLSVNQFPAGNGELEANDMEHILVLGKEGPKPVPDFALVTVVGCLSPPEKTLWILTSASEPIRTRNPRESEDAELSAAVARPAGAHKFGLIDTINFPAELRAGHWMEAKGFLIRAPGDDRINLTWLHTLQDTCEATTSH